MRSHGRGAGGNRRRWAAAVCLVLAATVHAQGPFEGFDSDAHAHDGVSVSPDGYGIWVHWKAANAVIRYPEHRELRIGQGEYGPTLRWAMIVVSCRATGGANPRPVQTHLVLPLHPDMPSVPPVIHPKFWWRLATGMHERRLPVRIVAGRAPPHPSELVLRRIDWSFERPDVTAELDAGAALEALRSTEPLDVTAEGPEVYARLRLVPHPVLADVAVGIAGHCPKE